MIVRAHFSLVSTAGIDTFRFSSSSADAFDPDDMFKNPAQRNAQSPYALPPSQLNSQQTLDGEYSDTTTSDDDEPGHYGHHHPHGNGYGPRKPIVYAYDAAAEREKERVRAEERERSGSVQQQQQALAPRTRTNTSLITHDHGTRSTA